MSLMDQIKQRARENKKTIVLAEGCLLYTSHGDPKYPAKSRVPIHTNPYGGEDARARTPGKGCQITGLLPGQLSLPI